MTLSEGPRSRLAPYGRVADVQAALTFLGLQPQVDPDRLGIYGTSYGGATVVWVGAVDPRVKCIVSVVGVGHGGRWMRSVRRPDEWHDLLARTKADRVKRILALDGGGIRGILTLEYLGVMEKILRQRSGNDDLLLCDYFDLIGGTSTGSIIAAGLACGMTVADLQQLLSCFG